MAEHLESGRGAERLARTRLERGGLSWIASNYRCRLGELDLVMSDDATLVVVEVRYRRSTRLMNPCETLTAPKLRRVALATRHFVQRHRRWRDAPVRFDVVGIHGPLNDARMNWIRGAFTIDNL
ncbi:MAG: YraN family protein [Gammaproteobacteria bacterium]|nr:YraN family protein [Gammaproteobacteria bacterium]NND35702.1 YraN family protein [Gammaproteobacteria bacterium]